MIFWIFFLCTCYLLLMVYNSTRISEKQKVYALLGLMFVCVYFSTFRDGVGTDYTAYQTNCEIQRNYGEFWLLTEPFPELLYSLCYNSKISAVLFFFVTSSIICVSSLWVYSKFKYFCIAGFLFITYTNLFLSSLNLVRQFTAASIVLFATYYFVMKKKSPLFFLFVFLAFLWHKSALLSVFIYFLRQKDFNTFLGLLVLLISWIAPVDRIFNIPIIGDVLDALNYLNYSTYEKESYSRTSLVNLYVHLIIIISIAGKSKIKNEDDRRNFNIALKLSLLSVIFCNISANSLPFAYRYGIFFSAYLPILFSYLPVIIGKTFAKTIVFIPILFLLLLVLSGKRNDRVFCPQRVLPLESVYDENYHPYENPEYIFIE